MNTSEGNDSYWRLETYENRLKTPLYDRLVALGFKIKSTTSRTDLVAMINRYLRGERCHETLSDMELRKARFGANDLWRERDKMSYSGRMELIQTLRERETDPCGTSFKRFQQLPPELRARVYEYYIASFPKCLRTPAQPPLAWTCKLVRQEVLPVFYGSLEFEIRLTRTDMARARFHEDNKSQLFLLTLAPKDLACIQKLKVILPDWTWFALNLNPDNASRAFDFGLRPDAIASLQNDMLALRDALPTTALGRKYFRLQDVYKLRGIVERVYEML